MRYLQPLPGRTGEAASMGGWYLLPLSMPDPCQVKVIAWPEGSHDIEVEDDQGRRWWVRHWLVDCGCEFLIGGAWVHESDPRILDRFQAVLREPALPNTEAGPRYSEGFRKTAEKILRRNGRVV